MPRKLSDDLMKRNWCNGGPASATRSLTAKKTTLFGNFFCVAFRRRSSWTTMLWERFSFGFIYSCRSALDHSGAQTQGRRCIGRTHTHTHTHTHTQGPPFPELAAATGLPTTHHTEPRYRRKGLRTGLPIATHTHTHTHGGFSFFSSSFSFLSFSFDFLHLLF